MPIFDYNELDEFRGLINEPDPSGIPPTPTPTPGGGLFDENITGLTGGGSTNLDGFDLHGSGPDFQLDDLIQFDISDANGTGDIPSGFCTYRVRSEADIIAKDANYAANPGVSILPSIVVATDYVPGDPVWERRG